MRARAVRMRLGGALALALALADIRPRRVASRSLLAPAGLGPEIDAASLTGIVHASRAESLAPWLHRLTATPDGISDSYVRAAMKGREDAALRASQADMAKVIFPDGVQPSICDRRCNGSRLRPRSSGAAPITFCRMRKPLPVTAISLFIWYRERGISLRSNVPTGWRGSSVG